MNLSFFLHILNTRPMLPEASQDLIQQLQINLYYRIDTFEQSEMACHTILPLHYNNDLNMPLKNPLSSTLYLQKYHQSVLNIPHIC